MRIWNRPSKSGYLWLAGGFAFAASFAWAVGAPGQDPAQPSGVQAALAIERAAVDAIARAERSVVAIARVRRGSDRLSFHSSEPDATDPSFVPHDYGTGVVVGSDGLILTNYHVLGSPDENDYYVWTNRIAYRASLVKAADPWLDLAVLKIDAENLTPISFGETANLRKGQIVIALGNPYAIARDGQVSASWGIISNLFRKSTKNPTHYESQPRGETLHHYGTLIQTDARLNLGTSGGALINLNGEMIGLTSSLAAMDHYEKSAGFAIPVDEVFLTTLDKLKNGWRAEFGFLGVSPHELSLEERRMGMIGVRITQVVPGTPASLAGIRSGDVITHVDHRPIRSSGDLMRELGRKPAEAMVNLTFARGADPPRDTAAKLSKKYIDSRRPAYAQTTEQVWRGMRVDYATATAHFLENSGAIDRLGCVAIVAVDRDSPAWKAGLRPNTFVSFVERQRVATPDDFYQAVADKAGAVQIRLSVPQGSAGAVRTVQP